MRQGVYIDPDPAASSIYGARDLFATENEYAGAIAGLARMTALHRVLPDALLLELYAYEILERSRDPREDAASRAAWRIPFWPPALFCAAGITAHAWRELELMLPALEEIVLVMRPEPVLVRESIRVLGKLRFDPGRYANAVARAAAMAGWEVRP